MSVAEQSLKSIYAARNAKKASNAGSTSTTGSLPFSNSTSNYTSIRVNSNVTSNYVTTQIHPMSMNPSIPPPVDMDNERVRRKRTSMEMSASQINNFPPPQIGFNSYKGFTNQNSFTSTYMNTNTNVNRPYNIQEQGQGRGGPPQKFFAKRSAKPAGVELRSWDEIFKEHRPNLDWTKLMSNCNFTTGCYKGILEEEDVHGALKKVEESKLPKRSIISYETIYDDVTPTKHEIF